MTEDTPHHLQRSYRRRVLKGAKIVFNGGHSTIDCVVRNISETGALVVVEGASKMPEEFILMIDTGGSYHCQVIRRTLKELGVRFGA